MLCPVCKRDMIVIEHSKIELDYCTRCRGVWFDSGELELLLESLGLESHGLFLSQIIKSAEASSLEARRRCPICSQRMKKTLAGQPEILIDVCRKGDGLWFDGGEVGQLLGGLAGKPSAGPGAQEQLTGFLREVFKARD